MNEKMNDDEEEEECPFGGCIGEACRYFCDPCFMWMDEADPSEDFIEE